MQTKTAKIRAGLGYSLEHFFTDTPVPRRSILKLSGLRGETLSFQLAYSSDQRHCVDVKMSGAFADIAVVRRVALAHVEHPTFAAPEKDRIGRAPGFYPDPLVPDSPYYAYPGQTRCMWFTIPVPANAPAGRSRLKIVLTKDNKPVGRFVVEINVIAATLPKQKLKNIHWFHNDCLQSYYGFKAWSPEHWRIAESYLRNAASHGVNVITTPVFTPPLDTAVGLERPTMQLVDVKKLAKDKYSFGFRKLGQWIDLCRKCGIDNFEISHLATQWGAHFAPKIMASDRGKTRKIFGWQTKSEGPAYTAFLLQFLPALTAFLRRKKALKSSYLHVSDETSLVHLSQYRAVRETLRRGAPELPVVDANSDLEFYKEGLIDCPVPATNHVKPFLDAGVPHLWCYYCCGQVNGVSNRFMDFPAARNRILGWQLFKYGFEGFLHWGYNHWYKELTGDLLDPYTMSDGARFLPPGDAFVVYPGENGPVDSTRWEVFREGLQDLRALELLKKLAGDQPSRDVAQLLNLRAIKSMASYPGSANWILTQREAINKAIARLV